MNDIYDITDKIELNNILILLIEKIVSNKKWKRRSYLVSIILNTISEIANRNLTVYEFQFNFDKIDKLINKIHRRIIDEVYNNKTNIKYLDVFLDKNFKREIVETEIHNHYNLNMELYIQTNENDKVKIEEINNSYIRLLNLIIEDNKNVFLKDI